MMLLHMSLDQRAAVRPGEMFVLVEGEVPEVSNFVLIAEFGGEDVPVHHFQIEMLLVLNGVWQSFPLALVSTGIRLGHF